jgi:membrane protein DedA with SNARE-associated domain
VDITSFIQIHHLHALAYIILFAGCFIDAILAIFTGVLLILTHSLNIWLVTIILIFGVAGEQLFWYEIGKFLGKSNRVLKWTNKLASRFDHHFHQRPFRTLLVSKFVYGTHRPSLMRAGMLNMPLAKFVKAAFPGGLIWALTIAILSALLGASYSLLKTYLRNAGLVVLGLVVLLLLIEFTVSRRMQKEL